jgi:hypothetical protein
MPETLSELLNGGVVTARHPALLKPGELQRADDCVYREKDPAIWRAPGRNKLNAVALGSVWAGAASAVKGLAHMSFERQRTDQLLCYNGTVFARAFLTATSAPTIDGIDVQQSCTTSSASLTITVANSAVMQAGWYITGSNILPGTRIISITDGTHVVVNRLPSSSTTLTLTFNPFLEMGGPAAIAGTVASNVFTATTGFPFLADIIGSPVYNIGGASSLSVTAVSGQSGSTGHYNAVTLSSLANGSYTLLFPQGCVQTITDDGVEALDIAQYGTSYFVWNGKDPIQRIDWRPRTLTDGTDLDDVLTMRPAGLFPVIDQPTIAQAANAGYSWPATLSAGYYWFLVTEIYDPDNTPDGQVGKNEVESAYYGKGRSTQLSGEPVAVSIPALTGYGVTVTFPRTVNNGNNGRISTHWGVYMYGPTLDDKAQPSLAAFRRVSKVRITKSDGTQSITLTESRQTQVGYATADGGAISGFGNFGNPSNLYDGAAGFGNGTWAEAGSGGYSAPNAPSTPVGRYIGNFGFSTGAPYSGYTVNGIRLTIRGNADPTGSAGSKAGYQVQLTAGGASKTSDLILGDFGSKNDHNNFHGGEGDTWGVAWVPADFANGTFRVLVMKSFSGSRQHLRLSGVKIEVFYQSTSINLNGKPFRVVTYRDQIGDTVSEPAYGPVPTSSTGDLFQGSLVVNDMTDETAIRFSLPGEIEAFPKPYVMRFNTTKRKDRVTLVRTLGLRLIIGLENSIQYVNYLPTEADTDFHEGLAHDDLASDHGIPGPLAAVKFDWPARGTMMAYASSAGIFVTDGIATKPLNNDLDWPNTVKLSALSTCVFRVYPAQKWLVLYYCPAGATHNKNTRALVFHYSMDHVKNGDELPCTGPLTVSGRSSVEVAISGTNFLFTGHESDGFIYQEDYGVAQASGYQVHDSSGSLANAPIVPFIRLRRMHPAGITHDCHLYKAYLLFSAFGSAALTASSSTTKDSVTVTSSTAFGSVVAGMRVSGTGIDAGTIVKSVETTSSLTLSRAANATGAGVTLTFDTGTVAITDRGASIGEAAAGMNVLYGTTTTGDMLVLLLDDARQGLELQIEKVPLTFTTNSDGYRFDTATWADLSVNMRLHQAMILYDDQGPEQSRLAA